MTGDEAASKPKDVERIDAISMAARVPAEAAGSSVRKYEHCWLDPSFLAEPDDTTLGESD